MSKDDGIILWKSLGAYSKCPTKAYEGDAGWDLYVSYYTVVEPHETKDIQTSIAIELPNGYYGHIMGRSSTHRNHGLFVNEAIIDAGYRGELFVMVYNPGSAPVHVPSGQRLAQLIILPVPHFTWGEVSNLGHSPRSRNAFGSSGE
jgi:dUTP pyrophosphatase